MFLCSGQAKTVLRLTMPNRYRFPKLSLCLPVHERQPPKKALLLSNLWEFPMLASLRYHDLTLANLCYHDLRLANLYYHDTKVCPHMVLVQYNRRSIHLCLSRVHFHLLEVGHIDLKAEHSAMLEDQWV